VKKKSKKAKKILKIKTPKAKKIIKNL